MVQWAGKLRRWPISGAWFLSVLIVINGCSSFVPPSLPSLPSLGPPSEDDEVRISREFRREAKKEFKFVNDPEVERYMDRIGQRILSAMGPHSFDYRFFVVQDSQLNAFAVPGGTIYMYSGLIERAKSTDGIAVLLGHDINHITAHHVARSS